MIIRENSNYSNEVKVCKSRTYGKIVVKTPLLERYDSFWYWCEKIFGLHVRTDPSEILTKSKKLNELLDIVLPQALTIETEKVGFSVIYEYIDYNHVTKFNEEKSYQYGQFVGKIHQKHFDCWGNLYDRNISNDEFGQYICEVIERNFDISCSTHKNLLKDIYIEIKPKLERLQLKSAGIILLDVDADQYVYDKESNITGIVDYEAMVVGPREIELLMWEFYLKDHFKEFMMGYKEYCTHQAENMELYRFIVFLLDSLGSDLDFYNWFEKDACFSDVRVEVNTRCNMEVDDYFECAEKNRKIEKSIYEEIIKQLADMKYDRIVSLVFYNDKTLYHTVLEYIYMLKKQLPLVKIVLYFKGGELLTEELAVNFIEAGIDLLVVSNYSKKEKFYVLYDILPDEVKLHVEYCDEYKLNMHNGNCSERREYLAWEAAPCLIPDELILLDVNGNIIPCQNDYKKEFIMGNILKSNMYDVFNSGKYRDFRNYLRHGKRKKISICKSCRKSEQSRKVIGRLGEK